MKTKRASRSKRDVVGRSLSLSLLGGLLSPAVGQELVETSEGPYLLHGPRPSVCQGDLALFGA